MPASLFHEVEHSSGSTGNGLEDQRALQLALELSMLGLTESDGLGPSFDADGRMKKSQNTTECVPVPSSEHVAEIVGRQGCKIKALRAKTNTYIKTPVRGEEPVFVVTGRKEDVCAAKREIMSAADHFSQIRAQRKNNMNGSPSGLGPNTAIPGQTTIQVRVPYRVVGLVVGPKGATIKRIQQQTNTYIITPSRDKEPIFEVTGLPDSVDTARKEIEAHIAMRTGGVIDSGSGGSLSPNGDLSDGLLDSFGRGGGSSPEYPSLSNLGPFNSIYDLKTGTDLSAFAKDDWTNSFGFGGRNDSFLKSHNGHNNNQSSMNSFGWNDASDEPAVDSPTYRSLWTESFGASAFNNQPRAAFNSAIIPSGLERRSSSLGSDGPSSSSSISSATGNGSPDAEHMHVALGRRLSGDQLSGFSSVPVVSSLSSTTFNGFSTMSESSSSSPTESLGSLGNMSTGRKDVSQLVHQQQQMPLPPSSAAPAPGQPGGPVASPSGRDCIVCFGGQITAALVPCGHNLFCMDCANRVCKTAEAECPVCHQAAKSAIRIYS
ncbi:RNA-binding protein MEX3D [Halotydeus destructor]|nr:RNA-binding protein MEX3D [Halotydeus destructor]